jgi:hypothetical protein
MFKWLFALLALLGFGVNHATTPKKDYVGVVAAEAAYSALLSSGAPVTPAPLVDPKNCPTCKGVGKVPSGDGQGWTKCPTCQPVNSAAEIKIPKSDPERYKSSSVNGTSSAVPK